MSKYNSKSKTKDNFHQIYGLNGTTALLKSERFNIQSIDILKKSPASDNHDVKALLVGFTHLVRYLDNEVFGKKYGAKRTQGIVVSFSGRIAQSLPSFSTVDDNYCLLILDNLNDPQNLGQIIRTAECAGVNGIILPERKTVGVTDTVLQVSQGAFCTLPIYTVTNLNQVLSQLKQNDFWAVAIENGIDARPWDQIDYNGKIAIIIGGEGQGIKPLVLRSCDFQATIPMQGEISSLNVSAAASAVLFERLRQLSK